MREDYMYGMGAIIVNKGRNLMKCCNKQYHNKLFTRI